MDQRLTEKHHGSSLALQSLNTKAQQTLYSVRAEIMPAAGQQNCHSGSLCGLEMSITRLAEPEDDEDDDGGTEEKGRQRQRRSAPPSSCMKWQTAAVAGWCMAEAQGWCPCQRMLMPTTGYRLS
ncbi:uncharacterized protein LOC135536438 isoform X2 [Oncorhynchus masou masou]|uniref:uncharacterized protein LOC135536438 isoform X2 n=1 Tax=Oncorhynchus masou masou TaxID=90313 RepID=UPI003183B64F